MPDVELLCQMRKTEKSSLVMRRLDMLIVFLNSACITSAASKFFCDRRTISLWNNRMSGCGDYPEAIRKALSDRPRKGRPTKIDGELLDKAKSWCDDRAFTSFELCDYIEKISKIRLSMRQTRRYSKKWGYSTKKTSPLHIKRTPIKSVKNWRRNMLKKIARYAYFGYTIVTQDESHFKDAKLSVRYWAKVGLRILMPWSGGHHRFSMLCSMTSDGKTFFNHCSTVNTESFLEHIGIIYEKVGKMVLFLDRASWHDSVDAKEFFKKRDIIIIWYPVGHPYLNPVEEVWSVLKRSINNSIRYANKNTHLGAVYSFVRTHKFDYSFEKFWRRRPPDGVMVPLVRSEDKPDKSIPDEYIRAQQVGSTKKPSPCK